MGFDSRGLFRLKLPQQLKQPRRIERIEVVIGAIAEVPARSADRHHHKLGLDSSQRPYQVCARHIREAGVQHYTVDRWKARQRLDGLKTVVRRDDVEFSGLNHELSGGDAARVLAIDDDETWPD